MSLTSTIVVNAVLWVLIVGILVWLLAHPGIAKARNHEHRMLRLHSRRR
jgi:type IV secretory pathway TrbD component